MNRCRDIVAKRNQPGLPTHLDAFLSKLLRHGFSFRFSRHEDIEVFLLKFACDLDSNLIGRTKTHARGEAWSCPVDKLYSSFSHNHIVCSSQPELVLSRIWRREIGKSIRRIFYGLDDLVCKKSRHTCIQSMAKVG